ncbi:MAG: leucine-rich repeat domain-containing protein [Christensenellales bacterium]
MILGIYAAANERQVGIQGTIVFQTGNISANIYVYNALSETPASAYPFIQDYVENGTITRATNKTSGADLVFTENQEGQLETKSIAINTQANPLTLNENQKTYTYYVVIENTFAAGSGNGILLRYNLPALTSAFEVVAREEMSPEYVEFEKIADGGYQKIYIAPQTKKVIAISINLKTITGNAEMAMPFGSEFYLNRTDATPTEKATAGLQYTLNENQKTYTITNYTGSSTEIYIPRQHNGKNVTEISEITEVNQHGATVVTGIFQNKGITKVYLPNTLKKIGKRAFRTNISGSSSVGLINYVVLPSGLELIDNEAFYGNAITTIYFPESVSTIGDAAFQYNNIVDFKMHDSSTITTLPLKLFTNNRFTVVTIPHFIEEISEGVFNANPVVKINFAQNSSLRLIGRNAFNGHRLTALNLPAGLEVIGEQAFQASSGNKYLPGELIIPSTVTSIAKNAFRNCIFQTLTFEEDSQLERITKNSFTNLKIEKINFAENGNLRIIESTSFNKNNIKDLTIPASVQTILSEAFSDNKLEVLRFAEDSQLLNWHDDGAGNVEGWHAEAFRYYRDESGKITRDTNVINTVIFPQNMDNLTAITSKAFRYQKISTLTIPGYITMIGNNAFEGNQIYNLVLNEGIENIGGSAFQNNSIVNLTLPQSLIGLGHSAFYGNDIRSLTIPQNVEKIGSSAFYGNSNLYEVKLLRYYSAGSMEQKITAITWSGEEWAFGGAAANLKIYVNDSAYSYYTNPNLEWTTGTNLWSTFSDIIYLMSQWPVA